MKKQRKPDAGLVPCPACHGSGRHPEWGVPGAWVRCPHCDTDGKINRTAGEALKAELDQYERESRGETP
jgi:DnaJ-class molecular chaperone